MKEQHDRYDRLAVRLSIIISRLLAGHAMELKTLADEFGVSERTLQRDFQQRLIHLGIEYAGGLTALPGDLSVRILRIHSPSSTIRGFQGLYPPRTESSFGCSPARRGYRPVLSGMAAYRRQSHSQRHFYCWQKPFAITTPSRCRLTDALMKP